VLGITWVVVADLLLSSLCDEVGRELYEMDAAVRKLLLNRLKEDDNFGQLRINELSDFLLVYVRQQLNSSDQEVRDFAQVQRWTALAYVRPSEAARELGLALSKFCGQNITITDKTEIVRIASLVETFAEPLEGFQPLLVFARSFSNFACGDLDGAATEFKKVSRQTRQTEKSFSTSQQTSYQSNRSINETSLANKSPSSMLVILTLEDGDFNKGFPVTLQIGEEGYPCHIMNSGKLPPFPQIPSLYTSWQSEYCDFLVPFRRQSPKLGKKSAILQNNSYSVKGVYEKSTDLIKNLNSWLNSETFIPITETFLTNIKRDDTVRVIIQTEDPLLQRLPWYLWDLFLHYTFAEVALSSAAFEPVEQSVQPKPKVRILVILGDYSNDQNGISFNLNADKHFLENLSDAETVILVGPTRSQLNEQLWDERGWDILFFQGHSSSQPDSTGKMFINSHESLTIPDLKFSLQKAIKQGLQLAIFQSSDGLGIARDLAQLQIPQIIVMREAVADSVAQKFCEYFFSSFFNGKSLYLAFREARERLQALENINPCASWLPVLFSNAATNPPLSQDFIKIGAENNKFLNLSDSLQDLADQLSARGWLSIEDFPPEIKLTNPR